MLRDKEVIRAIDIVAELGVSKATAYKMIREIKAVSDKLGISGMVHQVDYQAYLNRIDKKEVVNE